MSAWISIGFAPKDGTVVDLWVKSRTGKSGRIPDCRWEEGAGWVHRSQTGESDFIVHRTNCEVTHYSLPLPGPNT